METGQTGGQDQPRITSLWGVFKYAGSQWAEDKAARLGAALAYYSVFSLGPILIIAIAIAGLVFGREAATGQLFGQLREFLGENGAQALQALMAGAQKKSSGIMATVFGVVTLLVAATGVVVQLKDALNTIWHVPESARSGIKGFAKEYLVSVAALLGLAFILIVSFLATTFLAMAGKYFSGLLPLPEAVWHALNFVVTFGILSLLFALMYKYLPDAEVNWRDVAVGGIGTAFLFTVGKAAVGLYLGKQSFDTTYGAASSLVVILIWVYYLSQVLFFGAEFVKAYALYHGRGLTPSPEAKRAPPTQHRPALSR